MYGGGLIQWEVSRQPFAVLFTAGAKLVGFIDGMVLGTAWSRTFWKRGAGKKAEVVELSTATTCPQCSSSIGPTGLGAHDTSD